jgi:hypothetical protein
MRPNLHVGKHDVGHLHHHSAKGRHSTIGAASGSSRPVQQREKSRNSILRRSEP